tara:strand:+ start:76 stop:492 length:417 start_codon:yes stop_codon:yes gene_type:complete
MKITKSQLKQIIKEELGAYQSPKQELEALVDDIADAARDRFELDVEHDISDFLEEMGEQIEYDLAVMGLERLQEILGDAGFFSVNSRLGKISLHEPEPEEISKPDRYDREERAIRRAGPKGPMSPEEHAKYMSLYGEE